MSTHFLKVVFMKSNLEFLKAAEAKDSWDPPSLFRDVRESVLTMAADHMRRFGSVGQAW
jgi:hypothetical protein